MSGISSPKSKPSPAKPNAPPPPPPKASTSPAPKPAAKAPIKPAEKPSSKKSVPGPASAAKTAASQKPNPLTQSMENRALQGRTQVQLAQATTQSRSTLAPTPAPSPSLSPTAVPTTTKGSSKIPSQAPSPVPGPTSEAGSKTADAKPLPATPLISVRDQFRADLKSGTFKLDDYIQAVEKGQDLSGLDLSTVDLNGRTFASKAKDPANLSGTIFPKTLKDVTFQNVDLTKARFQDSTLNNVTMSQVNLEQANLSGTTIERSTLNNLSGNDVNFDRSKINDSTFTDPNLSRSKFQGVQMGNVTFNGGSLKGADFGEDNSGKRSKASSLNNVQFNNTDLNGIFQISEASDPSTGKLMPVTIISQYTSFADAKLKEVSFNQKSPQTLNQFHHSTLDNVRFTAPELKDFGFQGTNLHNVQFQVPKLKGEFNEASLDRVDLTKSNLIGSQFNKSTIANTRFDEADLRVTDFSGVTLKPGNRFTDAVMTGGELLPSSMDPKSLGIKPGSLDDLKERISSSTLEDMKARIGSTIPGLRAEFAKMGLDGKGVRIVAIERDDADHAADVKAVINSPERFGGLATGAKTDVITYPMKMFKIEDVKDSAEGFKAFLDAGTKDYIDGVGKHLKTLAASSEPPDIVNMSFGDNRTLALNEYWNQFVNRQTPKKEFMFPQIRQAILGDLANQDSNDPKVKTEQLTRLANFLETHEKNSPVIQKAYQEFGTLSNQLWKDGMMLVVGAGNDGKTLNQLGLPPRPGADISSMTRAGKVLTAAASNTNGTPDILTDDTIGGFSSRGDGKTVNPTLAAPGDNVAINNGVNSGTSFATPYVTGVIALMKQANPKMSNDQILTILQETAVKTGGSEAEAGAGIIDPLAAVRRAQALK
jgi:uncharacterized protein YjbI with pentapeptide repeats